MRKLRFQYARQVSLYLIPIPQKSRNGECYIRTDMFDQFFNRNLGKFVKCLNPNLNISLQFEFDNRLILLLHTGFFLLKTWTLFKPNGRGSGSFNNFQKLTDINIEFRVRSYWFSVSFAVYVWAIFYVCTRRTVDSGRTKRIRASIRPGEWMEAREGQVIRCFCAKAFSIKNFCCGTPTPPPIGSTGQCYICIAVVGARCFRVKSSRYCKTPFHFIEETFPLSIIL